MSKVVLRDSGPLGMVSHPKANREIVQWLNDVLTSGAEILVPEIADYEVRRIASLLGLVEAGIVKARGGKVRLLGPAELVDTWDPTTDRRLTVWETTQHLIRTVDKSGESGAAALLNKLGGIGEVARELAYRLNAICERKKWAEEAFAYNGLVIAWPELSKLAFGQRTRTAETQREMF
jgi:adenine-specific DNA methylase